MITAIFNAIGSVVTSFIAVLGDAVEGVTAYIYTGSALTTFGTFLLIGFGVGLVYWAFRLVKGIIRR